ncbi:MAG: HRDC domain-containing protein, partial [Burkholderiales bacterium]|nr:HRDC domain-containing protein [Burkholderiales bacterium]
DVLTGKDDERIRRFGHDRVSTFGIGHALDRNTWSAVYRQLIAAGYLTVDIGEYGGLRLTEAARPVLRGEQTVALRKEAAPAARRERGARRVVGYAPADDSLLGVLKAKRRELAREHGVPAYVIFHDSTLEELAARKPVTLADMATISGVGSRKLERYGPAFVALIARHAG